MSVWRERKGQRMSDQKGYFWYFLAVLLLPHLFLCYTEPISIWAKIGMVFVPGPLYAALLLLFRRPGIGFLMLFPMVFFGAFQLVLLYLFGNSIIAVDMFLNLMTTNSGEALELLGSLLPGIIGVILVYIPALVLAVVSLRKETRLPQVFRQKVLAVSGTVFLLGWCNVGLARYHDDDYRIRLDLWPANIFYNIHKAREVWTKTGEYHQTSAGFTFGATSEHPDDLREVYILVIGETSRALNWELYGYDRPTNPLLSQMPGLLTFRDVLTQSNTTHKSVPMMLSAASPTDHNRIYREKSLITAFKEAGFRTAFLSNQMSNNSFIDFFGYEAHTTVFLKESPRASEPDFNPYDEELLLQVDRILADTLSKKHLIVLHTYGSHFNYRERYEPALAYFLPDNPDGAKRSQRDKLVNAYDNTIRYTDAFLWSLIDRLEKMNVVSALMYSPDHGEDIYDDRRRLFLHASPLPSYYQIHIPYLMWFSNPYDSLRPEVRPAAERHTGDPLTTHTIFHSMLVMGGIETDYRVDSLAVVSDHFTVTPRYYLDDHNLPVPVEKIGLKKQDLEMFRRMGLHYPDLGEER